jgi:hypothetical protein
MPLASDFLVSELPFCHHCCVPNLTVVKCSMAHILPGAGVGQQDTPAAKNGEH